MEEPKVNYRKLNLGCGNRMFDPKDGWINVDMPDNHFRSKPNVEADIRALPFPDEYADEVHAIHVLEHFYVWEAPNVLREWNRVLKKDGMIYLEMPDMSKIIKNIQAGLSTQKTWAGLYGDPTIENTDMVHKWCYTFQMIKEILEFVGFVDVVREKAYFHVPMRDMRVVARKERSINASVCYVKRPSEEAWNVY